jgi:parvulin-like peptidyl-prolyl isomerase
LSSVQSALEEIPFGRVGGEPVSLARALRLVKIDLSEEEWPVAEWPSWVVRQIVMAQAAARAGMTPSDEDLTALMMEFRQENNLYAAAEVEEFLAPRGMSADQFFEAFRLLWTERALRKRYSEDVAERHFLQHTPDYDTVVLSEMVVADENVARELALQVREEEAVFEQLVRSYSTAASKENDGYLGPKRRGDITPREAAAAFAARAGDVIGPFPAQREFRLLLVHEVTRAVLTPEIREEIQARLWREWLEQQVEDAHPDITVLKEL